MSVRLGGKTQPEAQIDGFKSRALKANGVAAEEKRWHYQIEWLLVSMGPSPTSERLELLLIGSAPNERSSEHHAVFDVHISQAIVICAIPLENGSRVSLWELRVVDTALRMLQSACHDALPVWLCTAGTQPVSHMSAPARMQQSVFM